MQTKGSISTTHAAHAHSNDSIEFPFEFWLFIRFRRCSINLNQKKGTMKFLLFTLYQFYTLFEEFFTILHHNESTCKMHILCYILNSNSTNRIDWTSYEWTEMYAFERTVIGVQFTTMCTVSSNWIIFGVYSRKWNMKSNCYGKHWLIIARFRRQNQASVDCWPPVGTLSIGDQFTLFVCGQSK